MDQDRFLQQLQVVLNPTQGNLADATGVLQKDFYSQPESLLFLIHIITSNHSADLKQLAAVEARSLVSKHWVKTPSNQKPEIRDQLMRSTLSEETTLARHSFARLISEIAKLDLQDGEWADLPNFLLQAATNDNKDVRAVGTYILFTILEVLGEGFESKFVELIELFEKTIRDPESADVRVNTLLALSKVAMHLDAEENQQAVAAFQNIFPAMVAVLKDVIDQKDEDRVMQAFEVFQTLLGCEPQLLNTHMKDLVVFMNQISSDTDVEEDTRTQAISFLMQCIRYRKLKIQGLQLAEQLTMSSVQIATELGDAADDPDEINPARSALGLLDMLAQSMPPSQVVVPLLKSLGQYFSHQNPDYRRAGIMALGMCVEGAPDFISTQMKDVFPAVLRMLSDSEVIVRQATLHTVARLADDLPEDVGRQQQQLMPLLVNNLTTAMQAYQGEESGKNIDIMKASVSAIDAVVDGLDEKDVIPYQAELIPVLQKLFKHPDFKIKALAASALGSIASSAGEAFLPYFDDCMHIMQEFATGKNSEDELELRANVTDAMGEMAGSAGPERYQPYAGPLMQASEEALQLDHSRLKETTYIFWGAMSKVYGQEFTPYLGGVVKGLLECLEQEETDMEVSLGESARDLAGQEVTIAGHKVRVSDADDDDAIEGLEGEDDEADWEDMTTVTPVALEKEIAVEVIGDIVTHTGAAYLPYFEKTVEQILPLAEHPYEGVRKSTIATLHRSYAALWQVYSESGQVEKWQRGKALSDPPQEIKKFGEILMTATIKMWADEDDRATVSDINRNVAENLRYCGPYIIADRSVLDNIVALVDTIITNQHPSQQDYDREEEDQATMEELSEFDWVVIDTALDVISGLATALGANFLELWPNFEKTVMRYVSSSEALERATAVGVLADLITGLGSAVTPFTSKFLPVLLRRLTDEDMQARSNTTYAVGRLVEMSTADQEIVQAYPTILERLEPCLHIKESRLPDNAAGCLARLVLKHRDQVPLADVIPALLDVLPLENDYDENDPVYQMICQLYKWEDPVIQGHTARLVPILQSVLTGDPDQLEDARRTELMELANYLSSKG